MATFRTIHPVERSKIPYIVAAGFGALMLAPGNDSRLRVSTVDPIQRMEVLADRLDRAKSRLFDAIDVEPKANAVLLIKGVNTQTGQPYTKEVVPYTNLGLTACMSNAFSCSRERAVCIEQLATCLDESDHKKTLRPATKRAISEFVMAREQQTDFAEHVQSRKLISFLGIVLELFGVAYLARFALKGRERQPVKAEEKEEDRQEEEPRGRQLFVGEKLLNGKNGRGPTNRALEKCLNEDDVKGFTQLYDTLEASHKTEVLTALVSFFVLKADGLQIPQKHIDQALLLFNVFHGIVTPNNSYNPAVKRLLSHLDQILFKSAHQYEHYPELVIASMNFVFSMEMAKGKGKGDLTDLIVRFMDHSALKRVGNDAVPLLSEFMKYDGAIKDVVRVICSANGISDEYKQLIVSGVIRTKRAIVEEMLLSEDTQKELMTVLVDFKAGRGVLADVVDRADVDEGLFFKALGSLGIQRLLILLNEWYASPGEARLEDALRLTAHVDEFTDWIAAIVFGNDHHADDSIREAAEAAAANILRIQEQRMDMAKIREEAFDIALERVKARRAAEIRHHVVIDRNGGSGTKTKGDADPKAARFARLVEQFEKELETVSHAELFAADVEGLRCRILVAGV